MNKLLTAIAVSLGFVGSASAADLIIADTAAPIAMTNGGFDWSGFYAGLNGG